MNTFRTNPQLDSALQSIPIEFRKRIIDAYLKVREAYEEGSFDDLSSLRSGKFCEAVLRFLQEHITGSFIAFGTPILDFSGKCRDLQNQPTASATENLRVIIPKALDFAFTIRNKRDVGHLAGDVDANNIDAAALVRLADWVLCELMREFRLMPLEEAQELLDAISVRQIPAIWNVMGKKRILSSSLKTPHQVLLLLHSDKSAAVPVEDLKDWVEYKQRLSDFKRWVLIPLHDSRQIEFDKDTEMVILSPLGVKLVEEEILPKLSK